MRATRASWQTLLAVVVLLLHATSVTSFRVLDAKAPPTPNTIRIGFNGVKYAGNSTSDRPPLGSDTYRSILLSMQLWLSYLANTTDLLPGAEVQVLDNPYDFVVAGALVKTFELISAGSIALIGSTYSGATKLTQSSCRNAMARQAVRNCPTRQHIHDSFVPSPATTCKRLPCLTTS
ncbi:hypothetical protein BC831DRAFT_249598 [Entophlyctis helioformis]|nr:hypothetical protein BC831DRAFT_249598 [Entophlyctis helioformis]